MRYEINVNSAATGFGYCIKTNSRAKAIKETREAGIKTNFVTVWDSKASDFVYWKSVSEWTPRIDKL